MSETIPKENKKAVPRPVSPPAGGGGGENPVSETPPALKLPVKTTDPSKDDKFYTLPVTDPIRQEQPEDIKAAMERQAGVGEGYPELPQGTKIIPKKISSEGTIIEDPEAIEAQTVEASQAEDPLSVPAPVKTAAAKYEAYVDPNTPEAQAVKGKLSSEAIIGDIQGASKLLEDKSFQVNLKSLVS